MVRGQPGGLRLDVLLHCLGVGLVLACMWVAFHVGRWGLDDAYITYRYAGNWIEGHGLVFNPGERVEGYTNFLYVLLVAPGLALFGASGVHAWSVALGTLSALAALYAVNAAARPRVGGLGALGVSLLFAASPALLVAVASGLETALVVALFATAWAALAHWETAADGRARRRALCVLAPTLAAMVLVRADGFVMAGVFLVHLALRGLPEARWRDVVLCGAAAVGTTLLHVAGRLLYYGYPLPNSYYAKVSGSLFERAVFALTQLSFLHTVHPALLVIALVSLALAVAGVRRLAREGPGALGAPPFEVFFPLCWLAYWIYVGGDVFGARFLIPLVPLAATLLVRYGAPLVRLAPRAGNLLASIAFLAMALLPWWESGLRLERTSYDPWITLGRFLGAEHPRALLAVDAAGKIPFFSGLPAIDVYGLSDATIAHRRGTFVAPGHSKSDPYYVLSRRPDVITGWIEPGELEIIPDLPRYLYTGEGYALRYLVFASAGAPPPEGEPALLDARGLSEGAIQQRWRRGYRYGVLLRERRAAR